MRAGYSKRSLIDKLGIKTGQRLIFIQSPENFRQLLGPIPEDCLEETALNGSFDYIHFFANEMDELFANFPRLKETLKPDGTLWISWAKKSSPLFNGITEDLIRGVGLSAGLVDVKVCAIDDDWSGLKFMYRRKDR